MSDESDYLSEKQYLAGEQEDEIRSLLNDPEFHNMPQDVYAVVKEIRAIYPYGFNRGRCAEASYQIVDRLDPKYNPSVVEGAFKTEPHSWVELLVDNQWMRLDVTVDQFGKQYPAVLWEPAATESGYEDE